MMRIASALAVIGVAEANIVHHNGQNIRGSGSAERMQPTVVAQSLSKMEDEWKAQALAFIECNTTSTAADDELSACVRAPKAFHSSCSTVVSAVVQASSGAKGDVSEYMQTICGEKQLQGWHQSRCQNLASVLLEDMTSNNEENRDAFDPKATCQKLWTEVLKDGKVDAEKQAAEEAAEKAEDAKQAALEDAKIAEQRKQEEEARKAADAKAEQEKAVEGLKEAADRAQDNAMAAKEDASAAAQKKEEVVQRKDADAKQDQEKAADGIKDAADRATDDAMAAKEDASATAQKKEGVVQRTEADAQQEKATAEQRIKAESVPANKTA